LLSARPLPLLPPPPSPPPPLLLLLPLAVLLLLPALPVSLPGMRTPTNWPGTCRGEPHQARGWEQSS
jgi:hypothetical protein